MAGDHKCPVCQSTFTRPQHVARHMRSHTGDRPYKCQHCGDQFARSDLLSRHVNKCHASEKPPTTTAPNRRKGSAAASRAATSKQACDQCVQSSLPCDGANPCAKCVQRKCRCTYVKFHRQTAPQGPGHPVPNQTPQPNRHAPLPGSSRVPDDFILAPQTAFPFPSAYAPGTNPDGDFVVPSASLYSHSYPQAIDPRDPAAAAASLALPSGTRDTISASPDVMARYRAQAELLSRAGVLPNGALTMNPAGTASHTTSDGIIPPHALYDLQTHQFSRYSIPPSAPPAWNGHQHSFHAVDEQRKNYEHPFPGSSRQSFPTREGTISAANREPTLQTHPPPHGSTFPPVSTSPVGYHPFQPRPDDLNEDFSDGGSTRRSQSIPSSASSSNAHLPLPDNESRLQYSLPSFPHLEHSHSTLAMPGHGHSDKGEYGSSSSFGNDGQGEGGFSSAFGLMSLDDPNVLAGLSADSAPFFSNISGSGSMNLPTPTQDMIAALKTGKSDMDSKEMKDFWKMYVRTPLSGPGAANGFATPTNTGQMLGTGRPSPSRRHSRVASLPSMKTPPLCSEGNGPTLPPLSRFNAMSNDSTKDQGSHDQRQSNGNPSAFSSIRTTLHDAEDLKSYEQAVLARRAPMNLNLVPKRRGTMPGGSLAPPGLHIPHQQQQNNVHTSKTASPVVPHHIPVGASTSNRIPDLLNRPPSTGSGNSSSLAHAFDLTGESEDVHTTPSRPSSQSGPQAMRPPSEASSTAVGSDLGTESDSSYRPSFKRLASQTLGPENTKRALLGPAGWDDDAADDDDDDDIEISHQRQVDDRTPSVVDQYVLGDRQAVGLADRYRRASLPTSAGTTSGAVGSEYAHPMPREQTTAG